MGGRRPEGWEEGQGQSRRRREPLFWEKEIKHLLQQVLGTPLGPQAASPPDPGQSWCWRLEEEASFVGEHPGAGAEPRGPGRTG